MFEFEVAQVQVEVLILLIKYFFVCSLILYD